MAVVKVMARAVRWEQAPAWGLLQVVDRRYFDAMEIHRRGVLDIRCIGGVSADPPRKCGRTSSGQAAAPAWIGIALPAMTAPEALWFDRRAAGQALAERLQQQAPPRADALVLGLPRGGVVVAAEVARALGLPLSSWSVRKLALPTDPEVALGALAAGGVVLWDPQAAWKVHQNPVLRDQLLAREGRECERRCRLYGDPDPAELRGRELIVVDDGIATGLTVRAALTSLARARPARLVLAVPVAADQSLPALRDLCDALVVLAAPRNLVAVGCHYRHFEPVEDQQVLECLRLAREALEPSARTMHRSDLL